MTLVLRVVVLVFGLFMLLQFFLVHPAVSWLSGRLNQWTNIVLGASLFLGVVSLGRAQVRTISKKAAGWGYAAVTLLGLIVTVLAGFIGGVEVGGLFQKIFDHLLFPLEAMTFALLAFYIASASFRAFRVRSVEATVMLLAAVIVILGRVPLGQILGSVWSDVARFILEYPNAGAKRAMTIGVGLGAAAMSIKVILGIERTYLGSGGK